jgi:hypothetical protein
MVQKDWPHTTFKSLRAQAAKPNVVENPAIRKLVEQSAGAAARCDGAEVIDHHAALLAYR